ncbi:hypothetical protein AGABI1DRAFT_74534 [Agaricus bisporus var. burnettii JB137-S8]|uniref:DUF6534 domain-containing protein n=1 Tax=Agaricus bisporus var. burnettii (strain JB137-S8 / ATCC MYA-4627 / FGSC 10392) TaxID=597362 RepID=K5X8B8_AGABU|nr:uncharacterized protein AGABI1DRAFT_74534 [Agaricus bisporus var. burnettii JB137-S8]EKM79468.1 hypothetical protein AGABI1DRAFT_74534 [Agaricus bisporus var. burnettii JB137-S8]
MFIGFMFNIFLFGVMTTQVYIYYTNFPRDRWWMKFFVLLIFILDAINSVFNAIYLYDTLILRFGKCGVIHILFHFKLTGYLVCGVVTAWEVMQTPHFIEFRNFKVIVIIWLVTASLVDVLITSALVWFLCRRHKTGFRRSDLMIDRIIRLTVQTGLVTSVLATTDLIVYLADASGNHLIFNYPLGKVYSNSLMSSLNSRKGWGYSSEANDCDDVVSDSGVKTTDLPRISTEAESERGKSSTSIASRLRAQSISLSHGAMEITNGLFSRRPKKRTAPEVHVRIDSLESRDFSPQLHWSTHADPEDTSKPGCDPLKDEKKTIVPARD